MQVYSNKGREFGMQTKVKKQKMKSSLGDKIFVIINDEYIFVSIVLTFFLLKYIIVNIKL